MKRALLLVNSGARQAADEKAKIAPALKAHGLELIEATESNPGHFAEIIQRFSEKIDMVITAGGDGTSLCAAKVLQNSPLPLGVIPLGTANNLARSLGIPLSIDEAARVIAQGHVRQVDVASVNGHPFLNVSGMGLSTRINRHVPAESKKRWGLFAYVAYCFTLMKQANHFKATVEYDGKVTHFKSRQITICNGKFYGSGLSIAPDASLSDGQLDLVSAHFTKWWKAFLLIPLYLFKKHSPEKGLRFLRARDFKVTTVPPVALDTDGEITSQTPAEYSISTGSLKIFAPLEN